MLSARGRKPAAVVVEPIARAFRKAGVSPNTVTVVGTVLAIGFACVLIPTGHFLAAALLLAVTVATDLIDGTMARLSGGGTRFGATLDATCDRLTDGALFAALAYAYAFGAGSMLERDAPFSGFMTALCLLILVCSQVVSYVKARAEASNIPVTGGLIERPERLILAITGMGLAGLGVPYVLPVALWLLAIGSIITVVQRLIHVSEAPGSRAFIAAPAGAKEFTPPKDR